MRKSVVWKPGTMIYPLPAVLVSCGNEESNNLNIITIAWTGIICSDPAMCYISIRPQRYSHDIIKNSMEYVINLTTDKLAYATDWCGVKSGRNHNKFKEMKLTPIKSSIVSCSGIAQSPLNLECKVKEIKTLGTHNMFISEIVAVMGDEKYLDKTTDKFSLAHAQPISYIHGNYYKKGEKIGKFGFSVEKRKDKKR